MQQVDCGQILRQGIFNDVTIHTSAQMVHDYNQFIYASDFGTHDQAIAAGINVGAPVYGIPVQVGGTFTNQEKDAWRTQHAEYRNDHLTLSQKYDSATKQVDQGIVRAWLECISRVDQRSGLTAKLDDTAPGSPILSVSWIPLPGDAGGLPKVSKSSMIGGTRIDGQTILYPVGSVLKLGIDANKVALRRNAHDTLVVSISTNRGDVVATVLPHTDKPVLTHFAFDNPSIRSGQSATLSWEMQNVATVTIAPLVGSRPPAGSESVTPSIEGDLPYTITAANDSGNISVSTNLHVAHRPRLSGIAVGLNTTSDDKDGDTSFSIDTYAGGRHIGSYAWNWDGNDDHKWEMHNDTSATIGVPVIDAAYQDDIEGASLTANVAYHPVGNDDWHNSIGFINLSYA